MHEKNWQATVAAALIIMGIIMSFLTLSGASYAACDNGCLTLSTLMTLAVALVFIWLSGEIWRPE